MSADFKTNKLLNIIFDSLELSQAGLGKKISFSQPYVRSLLLGQNELRFSELERIGKIFGVSYDIVLKKDQNTIDLDIVESLKKTEIKLIKQFSKEKDFEKKFVLFKKIQAVKILLDE